MADYNSSLPVRSEADIHERLQTKIVDPTTPSQQMTVDTDGNAHIEVHGNRADDAADVALQLSEEGRPNGRGDYEVDENSKPASSALIAHARNAAKDETHQTKRVSAVDSTVDTDVTALDVAIRDEDGEPYTLNNPLPVAISESEGDEIVDYDRASAVASMGNANHDYVVTALKTLVLDSVECSASSKARFELQIEDGVGAGTYTSFAVAFNSTANPNCTLQGKRRIKVNAGVTLRIIKTNLDNQAQDLYTTIYAIEKD